MKDILFIITDLRGGGAERALTEQLNAIDHNKYNVTLFLFLKRGVHLDKIHKNVTVIRLFKKTSSPLYLLSYGLYKVFGATYILSFLFRNKIQKEYDIIVSSLEGLPLLLHNFIINRSKINVSCIHCDLYNYRCTKDSFRKPISELSCYQNMDRLIFVSRVAMENFSKLHTVPASKHVLYNILNADEVRSQSIAPTTQSVAPLIVKKYFTITLVGSLIPVKGIERLIHVARMLKDSGYSFRIQVIGHGFKKKELVELRDSMDLQEEIHFLGFKKDPYSYIKQSDILVNTSFSEGLPYVICEAFALGIPVLATRTAGSMELLGDNEFGVLVEQDDISIFNGIKKLIDNQELREKYSQKGEERVKEFTQERIMAQFYQIINS